MSTTQQPIFLIGPRACGKTSTGRYLAQWLDWSFVDTDEALQTRCGRTIAEIIAEDGWASFREEESRTLERVTQPRTVISTGGGMVLRPQNCTFMRQHGLVFYLCTPASVLATRLSRNPIANQRPSLTGKSIADEVEEVLRQRAPLYEACAKHIVDGTLPMNALLRLIIHNL